MKLIYSISILCLVLLLSLLSTVYTTHHIEAAASIGLRKNYHNHKKQIQQQHQYNNDIYNGLSLVESHSRHSHDRHKHHRHNDHSSDDILSRRKSRNNMYGSLFATYLAPVRINDDIFDCIMDTGSSDMAIVVGPKSSNCSVYYTEYDNCHLPKLEVAYGDGNWSGYACTDHVYFGDISLGRYTFAGMFEQVEMVQCDSYHTQNGIIGLAYSSLLGPPENYTSPWFDVLAQHNDLPHIFSMQCCGWDDRDPKWYTDKHINDNEVFSSKVNQQAYEYAHGALDIGGVRSDHYTGEIAYTLIVHKQYYAIDLIDVRVNNVSVMPSYQIVDDNDKHIKNAINNKDDDKLYKQPETIVDSGTSNIIFTPDLYNNLMNEVKKYAPQDLDDKFWSGDNAIEHGSKIISHFPDVYLTFAGQADEPDFTLLISPCRYLARAPASEVDNKIEGHVMSFDKTDDMEEGNILGQSLFESYYVVHDLHRDLVGFAVIDGCDSVKPCPAEISYNVDESALKGVRRSHSVSIEGSDQQSSKLLVDSNSITSIQDNNSSLLTLFVVCVIGCIMVGSIYYIKQYKQQQYQYIDDLHV